MRLTDEGILAIKSDDVYFPGSGMNIRETRLSRERAIADAQIAKCQSYYASLGEEELKDKVARIIIGKPPKIEDKEGNLIDDPLYEFDLDNERGNVDKILSLILGWKEAQNG